MQENHYLHFKLLMGQFNRQPQNSLAKVDEVDKAEEGGRYGVQRASLFNQAMLGKQGWRLITRPDALCTKVIKGKYFVHGNFLTATRKKNNSETWRAMLHGREVLWQGVIKIIGPGHTVNIWEDNWIQGIPSLKHRV